MSLKKNKIAAVIMLIFAILFFAYAINHPEASFPWSNTITYSFYALYILIMVILFLCKNEKE